MRRFYLATTIPAGLVALGAILGGWWSALGLIFMTSLTFLLDSLVSQRNAEVEEPESEFPAGDTLLVAIAFIHFALFVLVVWSISNGGQSTSANCALFLSAGLYFGQVSNSAAHELIHRSRRTFRRLGMWIYISILFGHHTSAHMLVHHRYVATPNDPNSARLGESFYTYLVRAWVGSFKQGYKAEAVRLETAKRSLFRNPYLMYGSGSCLTLITAFLIGGAFGLTVYIGLAFYATAQLLLSDYVQHYGLSRKVKDDKAEPTNEFHSWDSPHWFSSSLTLNAPRHSEHHTRPAKPYTKLSPPRNGPMLPHSLPAMATLALFPSRWRRVMDHRAMKWQN